MKTTTRRTPVKRKKAVKPWWQDEKHMADAGRRAAQSEWKPRRSYDEGAVFESIMQEVLDDIGYDPDSREAERIYDRVSLAVTSYTDAFEESWNAADRAFEARAAAVGGEQAFREADAIVARRRSQNAAARDAVKHGHRITYAVEDAMNAAGFWLTSQGGNVFSYARQIPGGAREYIVSSRDHNPPTSLSEAVDLVREDANGQPVGTQSFRTLRQALVPQRRTSTVKRKANNRRERSASSARSKRFYWSASWGMQNEAHGESNNFGSAVTRARRAFGPTANGARARVYDGEKIVYEAVLDLSYKTGKLVWSHNLLEK